MSRLPNATKGLDSRSDNVRESKVAANPASKIKAASRPY